MLNFKQIGKVSIATIVISLMAILAGCGETKISEAEHISRAKDYQDMRDWQSAVIELKNALLQNPDNPETRWLLGLVYLKISQGAAAEKELMKARELGISEEAVTIYLGEALLLEKKFWRVLNEIRQTDNTSQRDQAAILRIRGDANYHLGNEEEGCGLYTESVKLDSNHVPAYWGLASCAYQKGDDNDARKMLDMALSIDNTNSNSWTRLGDFERAGDNTEAAVEAYTNALLHEPTNISALHKRTIIFLFNGKLGEAKAGIDKLKKLPGGKLSAQFSEAWLVYIKGDHDKALGLVQEVLKSRPDFPPALLLFGTLQYDRKSYQQTVQALTKYLRQFPLHLAARKILAATHIQINEPDTALELLKPYINSGQADAQILSLAGKAYLGKDDPSNADKIFEKAIELVPMNAALHTQLGLTRLSAGREEDAIEVLQNSSTLGTKNYRADITLAYYYIEKHQYDAALNTIDVLEEKLPDSAGPHNLRGIAYIGKKDLISARKSFEKALQLDPTLTSVAARIAALDLQENNIPAARKRYHSVLEKDKSNISALVGLAELAAAEKDENQYLALLKRAAAAKPTALVPRVMIANYYLRKGEHQQAISIARETVVARPNSPEALSLLAKMQLNGGEAASAVSNAAKVVEIMPKSAEARFHLAKAYAALGNMQETRKVLHRTLEIDPNYIQARDTLSALDARLGDHEQALEFAKSLQDNAPASATGLVLEGDAWMSTKSWQLAAQAYEKALGRAKDSSVLVKLHSVLIRSKLSSKADKIALNWQQEHPQDQFVRLYLAQSYTHRQLNSKAIEQYETLLAVVPDNAIALNNLALLYSDEKDPRALQTAERAFALMPNNPDFADTLGWILVLESQIERGLGMLEQAYAGKPNDAQIRYHLAYALNESGQATRAREELAKLQQVRLAPELERQVTALLQNLP